jgi:peptide subunit release factor RF-3
MKGGGHMKPQEALILYMKYKMKSFATKRKYITEAIETDMIAWDDHQAYEVLTSVVAELKNINFDPAPPMTPEACPYCVKTGESCGQCFYGTAMVDCHDNLSTYAACQKTKSATLTHEKLLKY